MHDPNNNNNKQTKCSHIDMYTHNGNYSNPKPNLSPFDLRITARIGPVTDNIFTDLGVNC